MITTWSRLFLVMWIVLTLTLSAIAEEKSLAGIKITMSKQSVVQILGVPSGKMVPLPPMEIGSPTPGAATDPNAANINGGAASMAPMQQPPNSLLFINNLTKPANEVWIGASTVVLSGNGSGAGMPAGNNNQVFLPVWAYTVRAHSLNIGQEQLIYRINDTYSLGITLTKEGDALLVTDIVASSFEPLKTSSSVKEVNYTKTGTKKAFPVRTAKNIKIGSSYTDVIKTYGWPQFIYPYVTQEVSKIRNGQGKNVPVVYPIYTTTPNGGVAVNPAPNLWQDTMTVNGYFPVRFTDGSKESFGVGFSKHSVILYPDENVAFTLINHKVIRVQVGKGVTAPPESPVASPAGLPAFGGGGGTPAGGGGGAANQDQWW